MPWAGQVQGMFIGYLLACLPASVCLALVNRPGFFAMPEFLRRADIQLKGRAQLVGVLGCLVVVPLALLAFGSGAHIALLVAAVVSFLGALWGAIRLGGGLGAAAAVLLGALAWASGGTSAVWAANLLSVLAGLGAAHLIQASLPRKPLVVFCAAFAVLDTVLVSSGLVNSAVNHLPLVGSFATFTAHAPVFNRIQVGGALLGTGDIAYAGLVASLVVAAGVRPRHVLLVALVYLAGSLAAAALATQTASSMPATVPGLAALLVLALLRRVTAQLALDTGPASVPLG